MSDSQAFESEKLRGDQQTLLPAHQAVPGQFCCQGCVLRADRKAKARRSRRRAVHFLAIFAITCWVGLHFFGGVAFWKSGNNMGRLDDDGPVDFPIPSDVQLGECAYWEDAPSRWSRFRSKTSFELPLSSDKLFLLSRGIIAGDVKVEATDDESDVATVTVIADYRDENGLDWIKVCEVEKGEKEKGVGLFGPHHIHHPYHGAHLGVTVSLPRGGADKVLNIKNFETDLSIFSHHIGDLVGKVTFDNITLRSANAPIGVDSLVAQYADVASANAAIEGHFDVTDELRLHTANAPIKVQANLYNAAEGKTTTLDMSTSNGPIKSELNLYSTDKDAGGDFVVRANTAMGPLDLIFQSAPVDSALSVHASTALGPATVKLHKTYEGTFEASTSLKRPTVVANRDAEDPAGKGRKRDVKISQSGNTVKGVTSWSDEGKERGSVEVSTSLAAVTLVL